MLANPEAARFVLVSQPHLFNPTYPKCKEKLIGPSALFFHTGNYHACMRKLVQTSFSPEVTRKLIHDIEILAISSLESWGNGQVINTFEEMKKVLISLRVSHLSRLAFINFYKWYMGRVCTLVGHW